MSTGTDILRAAQLASHIGYLLVSGREFYLGRMELFTSLFATALTSFAYHACLAYDACLNDIYHHGAADYVVGSMTLTIWTLQLVKLRRSIAVPVFIWVSAMLVNLYPRSYGSVGPVMIIPLSLLVIQFVRPTFLGLGKPFHAPFLVIAIGVTSALSLVTLIYPRAPGETGYDAIHSAWHLLSALIFFFMSLLIDHDTETCPPPKKHRRKPAASAVV